MKSSKWPVFILVAVLCGASIFGFYRLLALRFEAGDVYPPYSTLRTDPLGTKVLYDALEEVPAYKVSRNYQSLEKIMDPGSVTFLCVGVGNDPWTADDEASVETLARDGARVVITMLPAEQPSREVEEWRKSVSRWGEPDKKLKPKAKGSPAASPKAGPTASPKAGASASPNKKKEEEEQDDEDTVKTVAFSEVLKNWGLSVAYRERSFAMSPLEAESAQGDTEPALSWHTSVYFPKPPADWRVLYKCEGEAAILERPYGRGSIVLAGDSYFLSNEAMRAERAPRLVAWILGTHSRLIFDETHLGVQEEPGISTLMRKYNLYGLVGALGVLALLFVWKTSASFMPPRAEHDEGEVVTGKDSTAGFVSLLRRGIAPGRLMEMCVEQWKKSFAHQPGKWKGMVARVEAASMQGGREPVGTYQTISQLLADKK